MEIDFKGKRALVTGAGKGLGRAIAKALWSGGAVTHVISRTQADLDSLKEECPGIHTNCLDLAVDWQKTGETVESLGPMDLLVNNAGLYLIRDGLNNTEEDYDRIFNCNVKSVLNVSQVVARGMVQHKQGGAIVNISSSRSSRGSRDTLLYRSSKGALDQITRCMAVELGPHQIRVNSVNPGLVPDTAIGKYVTDTKPAESLEKAKSRIPLGRFGQVQEVVNATLYLLSDKSDMINGAFLPVDGGYLCT